MHGFKDFLLHLFTITIGLLIALSLEGGVEYPHHRHLAREAEDGLRAEIALNAKDIGNMREQIKGHQKRLDANLRVLREAQAHPHSKIGTISIETGYRTLDEVAWKTAQNTGALTYMSYADAHTFSDIYLEQEQYFKEGQIGVEDISNLASLIVSRPEGWVPTPAQADVITDRIGKAQFDLLILSFLVDEMDKTYQKFLSEHK